MPWEAPVTTTTLPVTTPPAPGRSGDVRTRSLAKRPAPRAELFGEELRLFPGGEVAALVDFVVVDEFGVGALRPASRSLVLLAREDTDGDGNGDALHVEEAALVFPVQTGGRNPRVGQPVKRDVVEELITSQLT